MHLYLLFIFALILRLINLNQSLWLDEAVVAKVVKTIPFHLISIQFSPGDFHPPLYYLFMSLWGSIVGYSEIAFRLPSICFSLIAGWYVFRIGTFIKNKRTGFWAAVFFLFNPLIVYYSQEARMYMMATMFLSIALYYVLLSVKESRTSNSKTKNMTLFNLFSALAIATFYGSAFFIIGMIIGGIFTVPKRRDLVGRGIWPTYAYLFIGVFLSLLLLSPLLYHQMVNAKVGLTDLKNWSMALGNAELKNILMIFVKFATGRLSWYPKWSYYALAGIPTAITWFFVFVGMKKNRLLSYLFIVPLIIGYVISFWVPMMMYFRFLYLIPVMSLLMALGVSNKGSLFFKINAAILVIFSCIYLLNPQFHREDWKKMGKEIDPTLPTYMILPSSDPVTYYNPDLSLFDMRDLQSIIPPKLIQVIPYVEEIYGYDHSSVLKKKGCVLQTRSEYRGPLFLEKWKCPTSFLGHLDVRAI